jgi:hypothetical protein
MSKRDKIVKSLELELEKPEVIANLRMLTPEVYAQLSALLAILYDESIYSQELVYKQQIQAMEIEMAKKYYEDRMMKKTQELDTYATNNTRF